MRNPREEEAPKNQYYVTLTLSVTAPRADVAVDLAKELVEDGTTIVVDQVELADGNYDEDGP